ncbi:MAG: hypothetical protein JSU66_03180 [Deltaproteobacteria bacterium]|nr:MAG: hypothetical protein JSU66_03180 [Deltaproteobacteria bacterium]
MDPFTADRYTARRKVFTIFGAQFHLWDERGQLVAFVQQRAFKLKEDIRVYADESATRELLLIQARSIVDFSAAYDVVDAQTGSRLGMLRRRGVSSLVRDTWEILGAGGEPIGALREDSMGLALVRRLLGNLVPQRFGVEVHGQPVGTLRQRFNPFVHTFDVDFSNDHARLLPRALGLAAAILLLAIEGRQG